MDFGHSVFLDCILENWSKKVSKLIGFFLQPTFFRKRDMIGKMMHFAAVIFSNNMKQGFLLDIKTD